MPRYALATLFFGYLMIGLGALLTTHQRTERQFYISQWFIVAALFWFPWIFSTACLLLVAHPVRGALQTAIDCWYVNNLTTVWFGFIGLAAIFYFVPKITKRPFYSHYLGMFIFWVLVLFGSWGGIPPVTPLPSWMWAMSTMGALLTVVPALAVPLSVCRTMSGDHSALRESRPFKFFLLAAGAYVIAGLSGAATSVMRISKITNFTWFVPAHTQLFLYGFFAMTMFGAMYYIVPRLLQAEFPVQGLICGHFLCSGFGLLFYAVPLAIGGIIQGFGLNNPAKGFADVTSSTLLFLRISTTGDLLMALGQLIMLLNFLGLLARVARASATAAWAVNVKAVEVPL
jgi:cytochrome c oxidase cbb3-type subunit 1